MKGINVIVDLITLFIVAGILFAIMGMFFKATPSVNYDSQTNPSVLYESEVRDVCFDEMNRFIDSCILNNTVILREEGHFEGKQLSEYRCKYDLLYKTGFNMTINCSESGKLCYIDKSGKYDIGKCK